MLLRALAGIPAAVPALLVAPDGRFLVCRRTERRDPGQKPVIDAFHPANQPKDADGAPSGGAQRRPTGGASSCTWSRCPRTSTGRSRIRPSRAPCISRCTSRLCGRDWETWEFTPLTRDERRRGRQRYRPGRHRRPRRSESPQRSTHARPWRGKVKVLADQPEGRAGSSRARGARRLGRVSVDSMHELCASNAVSRRQPPNAGARFAS